MKSSFPRNLWKFSKQLLPRTTFSECFCFGSCPCETQSKQQVFGSPKKHTLQVVRAILWNSSPEKFFGAFLQNMSMMESHYDKVRSYWIRVPPFFLHIFNFFGPFCRAHANNFFWSLDVFLVFDREALCCPVVQNMLLIWIRKISYSRILQTQAVRP